MEHQYPDLAVQTVSKSIVRAIRDCLERAPFDRTYDGVIQKALGNGQYKVEVHGTAYTLTSSATYQQGEAVKVMVPQGNRKNMFILQRYP